MKQNFFAAIAAEAEAAAETKMSTTFDDGGGEKDLIVMQGPLSAVMTQALNMYFAKTPIGEAKDPTTDPDAGEIATETQAIDAELAAAVASASQNADAFFESSKRISLVSQFDDFDESPDATVMTLPSTDMSSPDTVEKVQAVKSQCDKAGRPLVINVHRTNNEGKMGNDILEVQYNNDESKETIGQNLDKATEPRNEANLSPWDVDETRAAESLSALTGVHVVLGFEGLAEWFLTRSRARRH